MSKILLEMVKSIVTRKVLLVVVILALILGTRAFASGSNQQVRDITTFNPPPAPCTCPTK